MDLSQQIDRWNKGEISDSELLSVIVSNLNELVMTLDDVRSVIYQRETKEADARMSKLGL